MKCPFAQKPGTSKRSVPRRDLRSSRKSELGQYLSCIDWSLLDAAESCDDKLKLLIDTINIGLDIIMPVKHFKVHTDDPPWVTADFKQLIKLRQEAFIDGYVDDRFRHVRNVVNRKQKVLRFKYYASKVSGLSDTKPGQCWSAVKRISGMVLACDSK